MDEIIHLTVGIKLVAQSRISFIGLWYAVRTFSVSNQLQLTDLFRPISDLFWPIVAVGDNNESSSNCVS